MNNLVVSKGFAIAVTAIYFVGTMMFPMRDPTKYLMLYICNIIIALNFIMFNIIPIKMDRAVSINLIRVSIIFQFIFILVSFFMMFQITL